LRSEVVCTPRGSPAARNRFLHIPPAQGLQPLPSSLFSLFTLPLGRLVLRSVLAEPFVPANRPKKSLSHPSEPPPPPSSPPSTVKKDEDEDEDDESVDSFFSRRFGDAFARTLGSAFVHGIYAADSRVLSVRAAFPVLRESETRGKGSVVWGELGPPAWFASWGQGAAAAAARPEGDGEVESDEVLGEAVVDPDPEWEKRFRASAALFSFKEGMETLVRALVKALRGFPNVTLRSGAAVRGIITHDVADEGGGVDGGDHDLHDRRVSFQVRSLPFAFRLVFFPFSCFGLCSSAGILIEKNLPTLSADVLQINLEVKDETRGGDPDSDATFLRATHVISALPLPVLDAILQPFAGSAMSTHTTTATLPHLRANPHASVTVLNLVFRNPSGTETTPLHPPGFGYLIPRPEHGYRPSSVASQQGPGPGSEAEAETSAGSESRSEREEAPGLLGVVFDTASLPDQDGGDATTSSFTKLTAMLGGPYQSTRSSLSDAELVAAVLPRIADHLGLWLPSPVHYAVHRNEECIPTYLVGHTARMEELRRAVSERWDGRMKVVGAGVGGVSIADCVKAGRQAAHEVGMQVRN
jgi:oxygen-dependent protoporphyrinogen oxidase